MRIPRVVTRACATSTATSTSTAVSTTSLPAPTTNIASTTVDAPSTATASATTTTGLDYSIPTAWDVSAFVTRSERSPVMLTRKQSPSVPTDYKTLQGTIQDAINGMKDYWPDANAIGCESVTLMRFANVNRIGRYVGRRHDAQCIRIQRHRRLDQRQPRLSHDRAATCLQ